MTTYSQCSAILYQCFTMVGLPQVYLFSSQFGTRWSQPLHTAEPNSCD